MPTPSPGTYGQHTEWQLSQHLIIKKKHKQTNKYADEINKYGYTKQVLK